MPGIEYTVTITLPDEALRREFVDWLANGHVQAVCRGGATRARIVQPDDATMTILVRYEFPDAVTFGRYVREVAPALREEGLRRFGPERGVSMSRGVGTILFEFAGVPSASIPASPQV